MREPLPHWRRLQAIEAWSKPVDENTEGGMITRAYCPPPWVDWWWEDPPEGWTYPGLRRAADGTWV